MAKLTLTINDDAAQDDVGEAATLTNTSVVMGTSSTTIGWAGFRILNVTIPNAATIRHAYLKVHFGSIGTSATVQVDLKGEAADNPAAFAANVNDLSGRTLTTALVNGADYAIHDHAAGFFFFDVTAIVQEIVNRAGWASGNAMVFMFVSISASTIATISFTESANDPELAIIYDGSADSVRSPTVSGTGSYTNPNNAFASDNAVATTVNLTSAAQIYESFGIADLAGATIDGILVKVEARVSSTADRADYTIELSWDGGTTWTATKSSFQYDTADITMPYGGADTWGRTFVPSELTNANVKVRITNSFAASTNDANVDWVNVQVFYTPPSGIPHKTRVYLQAVPRASIY